MNYIKLLQEYCHILDCLGAAKSQTLKTNISMFKSIKNELDVKESAVEYRIPYPNKDSSILINLCGYDILITD